MRKLIIYLSLFVSFNIFPSQVDKKYYPTNPNNDLSFITTFNSISDPNINTITQKYKVEKLAPYNEKFLTGAIVTTVCTGVFLIMGITGSVLVVVSGVTLLIYDYYSYSVNYALYWTGLALSGVGWPLFSISLLGMIALWILYGLSGGPKKAMNKIRIEGASLVVKL